jgi:hypothetical protein
MQAELNKYFYNDITNIILGYHYKTQFYEVIKELAKNIKNHGWLIEREEDYEDEDGEEFIDYEKYPIECFIHDYFCSCKSRIRKIKRQNTMNEEDTDSDEEELDKYKIFRTKNHHYYKNRYYSPEEFAYKIRYPEADDSDCDW